MLGPAMRIDLILDMTGQPGERFEIRDDYYRGLAYRLVDIVYEGAPLRDLPPRRPHRAAGQHHARARHGVMPSATR